MEIGFQAASPARKRNWLVDSFFMFCSAQIAAFRLTMAPGLLQRVLKKSEAVENYFAITCIFTTPLFLGESGKSWFARCWVRKVFTHQKASFSCCCCWGKCNENSLMDHWCWWKPLELAGSADWFRKLTYLPSKRKKEVVANWSVDWCVGVLHGVSFWLSSQAECNVFLAGIDQSVTPERNIFCVF